MPIKKIKITEKGYVAMEDIQKGDALHIVINELDAIKECKHEWGDEIMVASQFLGKPIKVTKTGLTQCQKCHMIMLIKDTLNK